MRRVDEDGCCVACGRDFCDPDTGEERGDGTRVPNARLSNAALDLLEACELMLETALATHTAEHYVFVAAVIAKATGEVQSG